MKVHAHANTCMHMHPCLSVARYASAAARLLSVLMNDLDVCADVGLHCSFLRLGHLRNSASKLYDTALTFERTVVCGLIACDC